MAGICDAQDWADGAEFAEIMSMGAAQPATKKRNSEAQNRPVNCGFITYNNLSWRLRFGGQFGQFARDDPGCRAAWLAGCRA